MTVLEFSGILASLPSRRQAFRSKPKSKYLSNLEGLARFRPRQTNNTQLLRACCDHSNIVFRLFTYKIKLFTSPDIIFPDKVFVHTSYYPNFILKNHHTYILPTRPLWIFFCFLPIYTIF